ncbi:hypothetical protein K504DRAFT_381442 [Pleomassaria siparia CBS 279.74]|uniref:CENP-V/GFA domain-containing protein n=1 Tax=Pleomassaria siparia CBS 279.74 TaxID=1314801 RepID=A0A6G1K659_9PLEO|nr:hypothetical protein K504DRAFT_381442 [Pleomassaria siparia CBS 279.74]
MPPLTEFDPANSQTYEAICHCGAMQYSVTLSPPLTEQKVVSCNCSICARNGYLLVYPYRENFNLKSGEDVLGSYSFGRKRIMHKFCSRCGSAVFFDPKLESPDILGVNVRMFKDVNLNELELNHIDGWNSSPFVDSEHLK